MTGKADRRRPFIVLSALIAIIGAALVAPVLIGARYGEPIPGSTVRAESRDVIAITSPLTVSSAPAVTLERGRLSLAADGVDDTRLGAVARALASERDLDVILDDAMISIDRSQASGDESKLEPEERLSETLATVASTLAGFKFRNLHVSDATVVVLTGGNRETFSQIEADLSTDANGLVTAKGRLSYRGETMDFDAAFTPPSEDVAEPLDVRASVKSDHFTLAFSGRMPPGERSRVVAENAELSIADVRGAAGWLGAAWPEGPGLGPFSAKGELTLDERSISFANARVTLDGNPATGTVTLVYAAERPLIEGTLAFASFDLTPFTTLARPTAMARATGWLSRLGIPGLADSSLVNGLDADLRISAASVTNKSTRLGRAAASLSIKAGKLYGEIVELAFDQGGGGEAQFTVDMTNADPRYTIRADLSDIDFATLPRLFSDPAVLEGYGALNFDLSAEGSTESALLRSIAGTMSLELREAGRLGIDIDALPAVAEAAPPSEGWGAVGAGTTAVVSLSAHFKALGGVFTADGVEARLGQRTVRLIGSADLDSAAVDFVFSLDAGPGADGKSGAPVGAFKVQGPWAAPTIRSLAPGRAAQDRIVKPGREPG